MTRPLEQSSLFERHTFGRHHMEHESILETCAHEGSVRAGDAADAGTAQELPPDFDHLVRLVGEW